MEEVIPIVAVAGFFITIIVVIAVVSTNGRRKAEDRQKTLRMAIERSDNLSPEVMDALQSMQKKPKTPMNDVRAGLILMAIAGGLMLWRFLDHGEVGGGLAGIAAVPGMIGVALLILGVIGLNRKA